MILSIGTIANSIRYKVEHQLGQTTDPRRILDLDSVTLCRLINYGYAVDDNVHTLTLKYGNIMSLPPKKQLTSIEKLTLKEKQK